MLAIVRSRRFKQDVRRMEKRGKNLGKLRDILVLLIARGPLLPEYRDYALRGGWAGYRDLHIEPDWLLLYRVEAEELQLVRTGTHSDLFDE